MDQGVARRRVPASPAIPPFKSLGVDLGGSHQTQVESLLQLEEAQIEIDAKPRIAREVLGNAAAMRGYFAMMTGDDSRALELTELAEALLPESSVQARSILPYTLGVAYRGQGELRKSSGGICSPGPDW